MNLDKSQKRIAKYVNRGFQGYPIIDIRYYGDTADQAIKVIVAFTEEEGGVTHEQVFESAPDIRENETIQSTLVKVIERADAKTVTCSGQVTRA